VREILHALQFLTTTEAGATESRRLSFRALDVEQIGHIYEGTLDHAALVAAHNVVGLIGKQGVEPEVELRAVEDAAAAGREQLVDYLHGVTGRTPKQLGALLDADVDADAQRRLSTATGNDAELTARLLPFVGVLREDLRGLPVVFVPGSIYVTETTARRDTGTEYTPRELAEEIVVGALELLVYEPGLAQGSPREQWRLKSSEDLLALRVCDPAVGSGAILVAACRYLADRLVEAWEAEGRVPPGYQPDATALADEDDLLVMARRAVADHCLFGVDRDPMAVEMAKLSLWLTTMSRERPFTLVDHAITAGDSLLGGVDLDQITAFHLDPVKGRRLHADLFGDLRAEINPLVREAMRLRRELADLPVITVRDVQRKATLFEQSQRALAEAGVLADVVVAAALVGGADADVDTRLVALQTRVLQALTSEGEDRAAAFAGLAATARGWLDAGKPAGAPARHPLHWPLAFPDVMDGGGFDAMVGNPPFLGGQRLTARIGTDLRELLVRWVADGRRGSADVVTYFFLRAAQVARAFGFIATNTIAQGDTREVGLDWLTDNGWTIYAANKSRPWPGSASLEIAQVWCTRRDWAGESLLGGAAVPRIVPTLDAVGRVTGAPEKLKSNEGIAFIGSYVLGMGFTMTEAEARAMTDADPRNAEVLFPYLNGHDLNQSPTQSASRWVINFFDWSEERAATYRLPFEKVERDVKPERLKLRPDGRPVVSAGAHAHWWRYERPRPALYRAIQGLDRVIVIAQTSNTLQPSRFALPVVSSHTLIVFASSQPGLLGLLASNVHRTWITNYGPTMRTDIRYTPSDVFETFPFPLARPATPESDPLASLATPGEAMEAARNGVMSGRGIGLTSTYNLVNDPDCTDADVQALRDTHVALDLAVLRAYGWPDLDPDHGFHDTAQGRRFTIGPAARTELLDRLLELNHTRHAAEAAAGLHSRKKPSANRAAARSRRPRGSRATDVIATADTDSSAESALATDQLSLDL
jgi:hypothetical protein